MQNKPTTGKRASVRPANTNTPASVATAADAAKASQAGIKPVKASMPSVAPLVSPKPAKPRKARGKAAGGVSGNTRHRKPAPPAPSTPSAPPSTPSPAGTVTIPRHLAEHFADGEYSSMEGIASIGKCRTRAEGYLKCLRDMAGTTDEINAVEYAVHYRSLMLALGKGDDLPEPRQYVRQLKANAVRVSLAFPGSHGDRLQSLASQYKTTCIAVVKMAVEKYVREGLANGIFGERKDGVA